MIKSKLFYDEMIYMLEAAIRGLYISCKAEFDFVTLRLLCEPLRYSTITQRHAKKRKEKRSYFMF